MRWHAPARRSQALERAWTTRTSAAEIRSARPGEHWPTPMLRACCPVASSDTRPRRARKSEVDEVRGLMRDNIDAVLINTDRLQDPEHQGGQPRRPVEGLLRQRARQPAQDAVGGPQDEAHLGRRRRHRLLWMTWGWWFGGDDEDVQAASRSEPLARSTRCIHAESAGRCGGGSGGGGGSRRCGWIRDNAVVEESSLCEVSRALPASGARALHTGGSFVWNLLARAVCLRQAGLVGECPRPSNGCRAGVSAHM